jgi:hypothetical protein
VTNIIEKKEEKQQHRSESITFRLDNTILNKLHYKDASEVARAKVLELLIKGAKGVRSMQVKWAQWFNLLIFQPNMFRDKHLSYFWIRVL